ncbi:hypothetical protein DLAC_06552 [Tieghemostelium lacteum]|uniref:Uncharacterized protein n=1 Tax=Tieghemostelium lacteum TaxID=361077 RepID=A0A151ZF11_TIELA|nr:hypothetical protein DLAC_06552 [Tieghemostelium lacteum]|eukprot:KYQ92562.1 hypothetical protein DLAC_06552 [Tieghemostelium lacteum]
MITLIPVPLYYVILSVLLLNVIQILYILVRPRQLKKVNKINDLIDNFNYFGLDYNSAKTYLNTIKHPITTFKFFSQQILLGYSDGSVGAFTFQNGEWSQSMSPINKVRGIICKIVNVRDRVYISYKNIVYNYSNSEQIYNGNDMNIIDMITSDNSILILTKDMSNSAMYELNPLPKPNNNNVCLKPKLDSRGISNGIQVDFEKIIETPKYYIIGTNQGLVIFKEKLDMNTIIVKVSNSNDKDLHKFRVSSMKIVGGDQLWVNYYYNKTSIISIFDVNTTSLIHSQKLPNSKKVTNFSLYDGKLFAHCTSSILVYSPLEFNLIRNIPLGNEYLFSEVAYGSFWLFGKNEFIEIPGIISPPQSPSTKKEMHKSRNLSKDKSTVDFNMKTVPTGLDLSTLKTYKHSMKFSCKNKPIILEEIINALKIRDIDHIVASEYIKLLSLTVVNQEDTLLDFSNISSEFVNSLYNHLFVQKSQKILVNLLKFIYQYSKISNISSSMKLQSLQNANIYDPTIIMYTILISNNLSTDINNNLSGYKTLNMSSTKLSYEPTKNINNTNNNPQKQNVHLTLNIAKVINIKKSMKDDQYLKKILVKFTYLRINNIKIHPNIFNHIEQFSMETDQNQNAISLEMVIHCQDPLILVNVTTGITEAFSKTSSFAINKIETKFTLNLMEQNCTIPYLNFYSSSTIDNHFYIYVVNKKITKILVKTITKLLKKNKLLTITNK